ncbi:ZIP family metal transporter [Ramlibacter sp.]|uniref:ZIP family metal transporter n=1 Tax=Ramlibacter sp. TaxID=1917967 RepID=UPI00262EE1B4|nr:ZIP family metal transporter [Ramlibacter sp.]MDB5955202.1 zinc/iron permease [Ramlibacter sp.]
MTLIAILFATLAAGIGSVWVAAALMRLGWNDTGHGPQSRGLAEQHLLSLAAGALLSTAFMHLLPEALESGHQAHQLFATLLVGLVFFFLLDKAELWHHGHEHHHETPGGAAPPHAHDLHRHGGHSRAHEAHGHTHGNEPRARTGGWAVLTGDSVHCFGDGILIASAFMAGPRLGAVAALAVLAHEVPHHIGDLAVLRQTSGGSRKAALLKVSLAGAVTPLGGLIGWWLVDRLVDYLPFFLVVASSSFIYVALADLIPQLQRRLGARETLAQIAWLLLGILLVAGVSTLAHAQGATA